MDRYDTDGIDMEAEFDRFRRAGDVDALARVFEATAPGLLSVARHLARGAGGAEDLVQATFVTAIERAATFDARRNLLAWLSGILALHARKHLRQSSRVPDPARVDAPQAQDPYRAALAAEIQSAVASAVAALPERYAGVLRLHLAEQLAPRDIARRLGLDAGTARVQLHRGLKLLRDALPAGLGALGVAALPAHGLAQVREVVMRRGAEAVSAGPIAAAPAAVAWPLVLLAGGVLALAGGVAWMAGLREEAGVELAVRADAPGLAAPTPPALIDPAAGAAPEGASAGSRAPAATHARAAGRAGGARVIGRLVRPDGRPAADAEVVLAGRPADAVRVREFPPPADWRSPPAVRTDADGRFAIEVDPPRAFQFDMSATLAGHARLAWGWTGIEERSTLDVGQRAFEPACTVHVRVLGPNGLPLAHPFQVRASPVGDPLAPPPMDGSEPIHVLATRDTKGEMYILEGVPSGLVDVKVRSQLAGAIPSQRIRVEPGGTAQVRFVYDGPDPGRAIVVELSTRPFHSFPVDLDRVRLVRDGGGTRAPGARNRALGTVRYDGLDPGTYKLEVDDTRFEPLVLSGLEPGTTVRERLRGSAALRVVLRNGAERVELAPQVLTLIYPDSNSRPNEFDLLQEDVSKDAEGFFTGIVPDGRCELRVRAPGLGETRVPVGALRPGERRTVSVDPMGVHVLRGVVLDAVDGPPSSGATVLLTRGSVAGHGLGTGSTVGTKNGQVPAADHKVATGPDGAFRFEGLGPGAWTLRVAWSEWLFVDRGLDVESRDLADLRIAAPASGELDVEILLPDGAVHDGISLMLEPSARERAWLSGSPFQPMVPGAVRTFGPLPPGPCRATVGVRTGVQVTGVRHEELEVVAGERRRAVIDLREAMPARLRLIVRAGDAPAYGGWVEALRSSASERNGNGIVLEPDGTALLGGVAPGSVRLQVRGPDRSWSWLDPREIVVRPGQEQSVVIDVPWVERTLDVRDAAGSPLADAEIRYLAGKEPDAVETAARTDATGRVKLGLPEGSVRLRLPGAREVAIAWGGTLPDPFVVQLPRE